MNDESAWLSSVKVGDKVAIRRSFGQAPALLMVEHATPTQIHAGRSKYRRKDGVVMGETSGWSPRVRICEPTPAIVAEIEEDQIRRRVRDVPFHTLPVEKLRAILAIVASGLPTTPPHKD